MRKKDICSKLRSKEFLNNLGRVKEYTQDIWQKDTIHHPEFTPHGIQHSKNVVENISKVIPVELLNVLSERDIYYLCCACHLHDIGMLGDIFDF
jgi:HD-GYP domain-containing protein (c-di-GMP phosphodiesterase class II)